ncbi:MAG: PEGA domain-containing protein [Acidobacteria bacterium]|nr:PEGA domain-containing protein [Acidobacteriota bacterium]
MKSHRALRFLAPLVTIFALIALPAPSLAGGGNKGGHAPSGQGGSGSAPSRNVGSHAVPVGPNGHHGGGTRVVIGGWPWWGFGVGWGWSSWGYYGYNPWYYPAYYPGYGYGYPASRYGYPTDSDGPTAAAVELHISPRKASVKVDGYDVGQARDFNSSYTPLFITPGDHTLELSYPDHQVLRLRVHSAAGEALDLRYDLADGEGVDPRSETAEVGVPAPPAASYDASTTPPSNPPARESSRLKTGSIRIRVEPKDAAVYLDGEFLGMADELGNLHGALAIAAGDHTLEAVRPGYRTQSVSVTIAPAGSETVKLSLQPGTKD